MIVGVCFALRLTDIKDIQDQTYQKYKRYQKDKRYQRLTIGLFPALVLSLDAKGDERENKLEKEFEEKEVFEWNQSLSAAAKRAAEAAEWRDDDWQPAKWQDDGWQPGANEWHDDGWQLGTDEWQPRNDDGFYDSTNQKWQNAAYDDRRQRQRQRKQSTASASTSGALFPQDSSSGAIVDVADAAAERRRHLAAEKPAQAPMRPEVDSRRRQVLPIDAADFYDAEEAGNEVEYRNADYYFDSKLTGGE